MNNLEQKIQQEIEKEIDPLLDPFRYYDLSRCLMGIVKDSLIKAHKRGYISGCKDTHEIWKQKIREQFNP
jgi:hypothetical protein